MTPQVEFSKASGFLKNIIEDHVNEGELGWINRQAEKLKFNFALPYFYLAFSSASRFIRKSELHLTDEQINQANAVRQSFHPQRWNLLQCVRTYLLLMLPQEDAEVYEDNLTTLYETADVEEQVTLYAALPLLPYPSNNAKRAVEGIRTNITDVFDAIALDNPYPADYLGESAWNQMVLKAVFMQRPLYRIYSADERANPELAAMLIDFAHERWAADRKVLPELWRFVGPYLNASWLTDIEKVVKGESLEKEAGLLACSQSNLPKARQLLDQYPEVKKEIENGNINWASIGEKSREEFLK